MRPNNAPSTSARGPLPTLLCPRAASSRPCAPLRPSSSPPAVSTSSRVRNVDDNRGRRHVARSNQVSSAEKLSAELEQLAAAGGDGAEAALSSPDADIGVQLAQLRAQVRKKQGMRGFPSRSNSRFSFACLLTSHPPPPVSIPTLSALAGLRPPIPARRRLLRRLWRPLVREDRRGVRRKGRSHGPLAVH